MRSQAGGERTLSEFRQQKAGESPKGIVRATRVLKKAKIAIDLQLSIYFKLSNFRIPCNETHKQDISF